MTEEMKPFRVDSEFGGLTFDECEQRGVDPEDLYRVDINDVSHYFGDGIEASEFFDSIDDGSVAGDTGYENEITLFDRDGVSLKYKFVKS